MTATIATGVDVGSGLRSDERPDEEMLIRFTQKLRNRTDGRERVRL